MKRSRVKLHGTFLSVLALGVIVAPDLFIALAEASGLNPADQRPIDSRQHR